MTDEAGNLSIDFLAGFTIFMVTLIYVATLIPGLFIGLQSRSIDYDAVAYRTGVVLVEDPGMPYNPSWETLPNYSKGDILRFGLSLSKDTPNILSPEKISRFFCSTDFVYPDDYRSRAVFGDYPYQFNISFQRADENVTQSVGDVLPEDYGYSRRVVRVKEHSNATLDFSNINSGGPLAEYTQDKYQTNNATGQVFSVYFNYTYLLENGPAGNSPAYQINPLAPSGAGEIIGGEGALINLTGLNKLPQNASIVNLSSIAIYRSVSLAPLSTGQSAFNGPVMNTTDTSPFELYIDDNATPVKSLPYGVNNSVSLYIPPGVLSFVGQGDSSTLLNITMQFSTTDANGNPQPDRYLNSSLVLPDGAFDYNYANPNITQPSLHDGVVEVAVW
jgi:hypothetical protein